MKQDPAAQEALNAWFKSQDDGPISTLREQLVRTGPVPTELWPLLERLADINVVIECTDHLDDAALYEFLQQELDRPTEDLAGTTAVMHIDVIGGFSEEDIQNYLRYYADDEDREGFFQHDDTAVMPPRETPPFDRDRHLPQARCEREAFQ
jgi:hypothetical protein